MSGGHGLEICGPSNCRHKLARGRSDFFASLRSLPSAIDLFVAFSSPSMRLVPFMTPVPFSHFLG